MKYRDYHESHFLFKLTENLRDAKHHVISSFGGGSGILSICICIFLVDFYGMLCVVSLVCVFLVSPESNLIFLSFGTTLCTVQSSLTLHSATYSHFDATVGYLSCCIGIKIFNSGCQVSTFVNFSLASNFF